MTYLEGKTELCTLKLNSSYANILAGKNQLFSLQNIDDAMNAGIQKAWDYKLWPFAEAIFESTGTPGSNLFSVPISGEDFQGESGFLATVNDVPWVGPGAGKRNFRDYVKWLSDYPTDTSKIWSEFGGNLFFNANALPNPFSIVVYGKEHALIYTTADNDSDSLPFSIESALTDSSGNQAILQFAYAHLLASEKKKNPTQAMAEEKKGYAILDTIWGSISAGRAQNNPQNQGFFNTQDMFNSNRSNRNNTNIGNFP